MKSTVDVKGMGTISSGGLLMSAQDVFVVI